MTSILDRLQQRFQGSRASGPPPKEVRPPTKERRPPLSPVVNKEAVKQQPIEPSGINTTMARGNKASKRRALKAATEPPVAHTVVPAKDEIDVKIIVEGKEATEYPTEPENDDKTGKEILIKYVEVTSGAQFSFRAKLSAQYRYGRENALTMRVFIDGKYSGGAVWGKERHNKVSGSSFDVNCTWEGAGTSTRKLMYHFATLETRDTTNTDDLRTMKAKYGQLGTLRVVITREMTQGMAPLHAEIINNTGIVPEKALKGRSMDVAAQFKTAGYEAAPQAQSCVPIDATPYFVKTFLYRSRRALQSEMIIPRSPSPQPLEERAEEDLTPEEMRELIRKQKAQLAIKQEEKTRIKRERSRSPPRPSRAFKSSRNGDGKKVYHLESDDEEDEGVSSSLEKPVEPIEVIEL